MGDRLAITDMGRKLGGCVPPFWGEAGFPSNKVSPWAEAYLHSKCHLNPSSRLATIHQRHRQTDRQDRQRSDSIGRTVLETVAQKSFGSWRSYSKSKCSVFLLTCNWQRNRLQGSRRHQSSPPVLPTGESLSIGPVGVALPGRL